jgi:hypothetical protein
MSWSQQAPKSYWYAKPIPTGATRGESRPPLVLRWRAPVLSVVDAVADPTDLELVEVVVLPPPSPAG